jgi:hypothetical protein
VVAPKALKQSVPAALLTPCPKADQRPWLTTRDIIGTAAANEAALNACSAQVDGIRQWNAGGNTK